MLANSLNGVTLFKFSKGTLWTFRGRATVARRDMAHTVGQTPWNNRTNWQ